MEKLLDSFDNGKYNKFYRNEEMTLQELAQQIADSDFKITFISVRESVERDMKTLTGRYNMEEFLNRIDSIQRLSSEENEISITFTGEFNKAMTMVSTGAKNGSIISVSSEENIELDDILQKKNKGLGV